MSEGKNFSHFPPFLVFFVSEKMNGYYHAWFEGVAKGVGERVW